MPHYTPVTMQEERTFEDLRNKIEDKEDRAPDEDFRIRPDEKSSSRNSEHSEGISGRHPGIANRQYPGSNRKVVLPNKNWPNFNLGNN